MIPIEVVGIETVPNGVGKEIETVGNRRKNRPFKLQTQNTEWTWPSDIADVKNSQMSLRMSY